MLFMNVSETGVQLIDQCLLDTVSGAAQASPRRRKNHNFHAGDADASHRLLNAIEPDSYIQPHLHADPAKDETIVVLRGKLGIVFFDAGGEITGSALLMPGGDTVGVNIPHGVYHTVLALEACTVFFEAKAGPYVPLGDAEKASWAPKEGEAGTAEWLERWRRVVERCA